MRPRDSQRQKLYDAEDVLARSPDYQTVEECQAFIDGVLRSRWFQSRWGQRRIFVGPGRGQRRAIAFSTRLVQLEMPKWSRQRQVLLHELAHCLIPDNLAAHGREFAGVYLFLVRQVMGDEAWATLQSSFRAHRVHYNNSRIPKAGTRPVITRAAQAAKAKS
jgi:putative metallohydrolase (TIGR04338 family)